MFHRARFAILAVIPAVLGMACQKDAAPRSAPPQTSGSREPPAQVAGPLARMTGVLPRTVSGLASWSNASGWKDTDDIKTAHVQTAYQDGKGKGVTVRLTFCGLVPTEARKTCGQEWWNESAPLLPDAKPSGGPVWDATTIAARPARQQTFTEARVELPAGQFLLQARSGTLTTAELLEAVRGVDLRALESAPESM